MRHLGFRRSVQASRGIDSKPAVQAGRAPLCASVNVQLSLQRAFPHVRAIRCAPRAAASVSMPTHRNASRNRFPSDRPDPLPDPARPFWHRARGTQPIAEPSFQSNFAPTARGPRSVRRSTAQSSMSARGRAPVCECVFRSSGIIASEFRPEAQ